jgi:hypothetical protein
MGIASSGGPLLFGNAAIFASPARWKLLPREPGTAYAEWRGHTSEPVYPVTLVVSSFFSVYRSIEMGRLLISGYLLGAVIQAECPAKKDIP